MNEPAELIAIDLGSNSFRLYRGTARTDGPATRVATTEVVKQTVRLAAGLDSGGQLDDSAIDRACAALGAFRQRLDTVAQPAVRVVATHTWRVARNAADALARAESALGHRIEVITGLEEARLIYQGTVAETVPDGQNRLVVDIGGGSTEFIIGNDDRALLLESTPIGSVTLSQRHFASGRVGRADFEAAVDSTRAIVTGFVSRYRDLGWRYVLGTSGTAKAITTAVRSHFASEVVEPQHLREFAQRLIDAGHVDLAAIDGIKPDRRPALAGGLAALCGIFEAMPLESMRYCDSALGLGVLHDLACRSAPSSNGPGTVAGDRQPGQTASIHRNRA